MKAIIGILTLAAVFSLNAADWFVNNQSGSDSNDGKSETTAVKTFAAAMKKVQPGDTLNIAKIASPYYESLILRGDFGKDGKALTVNGNGAVISGLVNLDMTKWEVKGNGFFYKTNKFASNCNPRLFVAGQVLPEAKEETSCSAGAFVWCKDGFFFRPAEGKELKDYALQGSLRDSGVVFNRAKNIILKNLISEHHANDGFNLHGSCHSIWCEDLIGRFNGDDGFSAHEDVEVFVRNSEFHDNCFGIEDINLSRTFYTNVKLRNNLTGARFSGGVHSLTACALENNQRQIRVDAGTSAVYLGDSREPAAFDGECFIKNTTVTGGSAGLVVTRRAKVTVICSMLNPKETAVELTPGSEMLMIGSILLGKTPLAVNQAKLSGDKNLFYPNQLKINQKAGTLAELQSETQSNANSISEKPEFKNGMLIKQPFSDKSPRMILGPGF